MSSDLHLMLLAPIHRILKAQEFFMTLTGWQKVIVLFVIVAVPLYSLSALLHRWVEQPGIALGRLVAKKLRREIRAGVPVGAGNG